MAHILPFRSAAPADLERGQGGEPTHQADAQIIIFPGVRRERHEEPQAAARSARRREKSRPKRDRLELPD